MEHLDGQKKEPGKGEAPSRRTVTAERVGQVRWRTNRQPRPEADRTLAEVRAKLIARDFRGALNLLRQLKAANPPSFWRSGRWRLWEQVGLALWEEGADPAGAAEAFEAVHALRPRHVPTLVRLGEAWAAAGEYGRAFHALYAALDLEPDHARAFFQLGSLYAELKDLAKARRCLERAVSLNPREGVYWAALGYTLQALGEGRRALGCYERAARLTPKDPSVWNALGLLYAQAGEARKSVAALRRGLRLSPDDPGILLNLSTVYGRDLEDFRRALYYARRLLELSPNHAGAHHNLGLIYWALGEVGEAQEHLHRALELGSDAQEIWASYNAFRRFMGGS
ncbi:MAG: tetratricopeptide repeat protein [Bacillota bacterium]|nr:tetratricopeptide repeat protein [Bacillota bacterium]